MRAWRAAPKELRLGTCWQIWLADQHRRPSACMGAVSTAGDAAELGATMGAWPMPPSAGMGAGMTVAAMAGPGPARGPLAACTTFAEPA